GGRTPQVPEGTCGVRPACGPATFLDTALSRHYSAHSVNGGCCRANRPERQKEGQTTMSSPDESRVPSTPERGLTRRNFLRVAASGAGVTLLAACGGATAPAKPTEASKPAAPAQPAASPAAAGAPAAA